MRERERGRTGGAYTAAISGAVGGSWPGGVLLLVIRDGNEIRGVMVIFPFREITSSKVQDIFDELVGLLSAG
jgi:hypothetical protein